MLIVLTDAPLIFPFVFGGFDLLLLAAAIQLWFGTSRLLIEQGMVTVGNTVFGIGPVRKIPLADVVGIGTSIGMQSGKTLYYKITVKRRNGGDVKLQRPIRGKQVAERIAFEIARQLPNNSS